MRYPTRTEMTILSIVIAVLAALGLRFHAFAATPAAPRLLTCLPGQMPTVVYSYVGGWSQPIETCPPPIDLPQGLPTWPTDMPEGFTNPDFNQAGTVIQTFPDWQDTPEGFPLPESNTGNVVYNAADPVYAQLFQPNSEESACLSQGGVFSSGTFGSSCAYQSAGGVVEQPGTVVDSNGWTADQFGTTAESVGGTADQMGNVAPNFNNEEAASQACVNAGNIYVWGQGCDVVIPMGGVVEGPGSVVDIIGNAVSGTGFQAPKLGDPGVDATYCAWASSGFGACAPGSTVSSPTLGRTIVNGEVMNIGNSNNIVGNNVVINNGQVVVNGIGNVEYRNGVVTVNGRPVDPASVQQWSGNGQVITNVSTENHYHGDMGDVSIDKKITYTQGNGYVKVDHKNGVCDFYYGCANIVTPNGYALQIVDGQKAGIVKWPPPAAAPAEQPVAVQQETQPVVEAPAAPAVEQPAEAPKSSPLMDRVRRRQQEGMGD